MKGGFKEPALLSSVSRLSSMFGSVSVVSPQGGGGGGVAGWGAQLSLEKKKKTKKRSASEVQSDEKRRPTSAPMMPALHCG